MANDIRVLVERVLNSLSFRMIKKSEGGKRTQFDYNSLRDLILLGLEKAGESKDAVIINLGREIGFTLASVLKVPLSQLVENKKLRITIELVSKKTSDSKTEPNRSNGGRTKGTKKKTPQQKKSKTTRTSRRTIQKKK